MNNHSILFVTDSISGGIGRVIRVLIQEISSNGTLCYLMCINQNVNDIIVSLDGLKCCEVIGRDCFSEFSLSISQRIKRFCVHLASTINGRIIENILYSNSDFSLVQKYYYRHYKEVLFLKGLICERKIDAVVAFLNQPIFLSLLAQSTKIKLIISERNDPNRFINTKTTMAFVRKMYPKADEMVFQSPDARQWYRENTNVKGRVIFNPIKPDLPERYVGKRKKKIVNFCRISSQKNLHLLVNSFEMFSKDHIDYELYIYGDAVGNGTEGYIESIKERISHLACQEQIHVLPAQKDIHNLINDYAMFVSSSDFEGMSNSMLEAMAIGLPTICTDCPAGGARAIIKDHENGILVPVNDAEAMCKAMCEVADNPELAEKLSINGTKLKDDLAVDKIVNQWMEIING